LSREAVELKRPRGGSRSGERRQFADSAPRGAEIFLDEKAAAEIGPLPLDPKTEFARFRELLADDSIAVGVKLKGRQFPAEISRVKVGIGIGVTIPEKRVILCDLSSVNQR
jgi:hypothetical protein